MAVQEVGGWRVRRYPGGFCELSSTVVVGSSEPIGSWNGLYFHVFQASFPVVFSEPPAMWVSGKVGTGLTLAGETVPGTAAAQLNLFSTHGSGAKATYNVLAMGRLA